MKSLMVGLPITSGKTADYRPQTADKIPNIQEHRMAGGGRDDGSASAAKGKATGEAFFQEGRVQPRPQRCKSPARTGATPSAPRMRGTRAQPFREAVRWSDGRADSEPLSLPICIQPQQLPTCFRPLLWAVGLFLVAVLSGCSRKQESSISWSELIQELYDPAGIADLAVQGSEIYTSHDRTGRNNDYNTGFRETGDGWLELANLPGPGVMTRFWFTGIDQESMIRFMFDGRRKPGLEASCHDFFARKSGIPDHFTTTDQLCFYSGFPVPYRENLRILVRDDGYSRGQGKLFFQINAVRLKGRTTDSASFPVGADVLKTAEAVAVAQHHATEWQTNAISSHTATFSIPAGSAQSVAELVGTGVIRRLRVELDDWQALSYTQRAERLRELWVRMRWDDAADDSVYVPLGELSGQMWQPAVLRTLYQTVADSGFEIRFPMPFRKKARIQIENHGEGTVSGRFAIMADTVDVPDSYGYFHAGRHRSGTKGQPHVILDTPGAGRLAGLFLGVASYDRSFWVLESNESIRRDHAAEPFWRGTGLEDYFNGGWYYRTLYHEPLYGLTLKRPFRTVQYRFHLYDAVTFESNLHMDFERGPQQVSQAVYDSIVFYYLDQPAACYGDRPSSGDIAPPPDEFAMHSLMTQLWDYEKMDDFDNAEKMTKLAYQTPEMPEEIKSVLALRVLGYEARRMGYPSVRERMHEVLGQGGVAAAAAANLIAFHEKGAALVFGSSNKPTTLFLDGRQLMTVSSPVQTGVFPVELQPGRHVLVISTAAGSWPDWVHAGIRIGDRLIGTDRSWKCAVNPLGNWRTVDYDDSGWTHPFDYAKGPPEMEVFPFVHPDPYVGMQSLTQAIRASEMPAGPFTLVYRKAFNSD